MAIDVTFNKKLEIDMIVGGSSGARLPYYSGEYSVTPKVTEIVLPTKNKSMKEDLTVFQIPYSETQNPAGGTTVTIGLE